MPYYRCSYAFDRGLTGKPEEVVARLRRLLDSPSVDPLEVCRWTVDPSGTEEFTLRAMATAEAVVFAANRIAALRQFLLTFDLPDDLDPRELRVVQEEPPAEVGEA